MLEISKLINRIKKKKKRVLLKFPFTLFGGRTIISNALKNWRDQFLKHRVKYKIRRVRLPFRFVFLLILLRFLNSVQFFIRRTIWKRYLKYKFLKSISTRGNNARNIDVNRFRKRLRISLCNLEPIVNQITVY